LFSKSVSVNELIRSGVSNYLEFQNVSENYFYSPDGERDPLRFVKIPFSKSEVFSNTFLSFYEKHQLVKVIEACIAGYDKLSHTEITQAKINSTHIYEKEIELSAAEVKKLLKSKDEPIRVYLEKEMGLEKRMQDIMLYAIGNINENQMNLKEGELCHLENISTY
jgi:RAB protein geranylgeranyltransferase component A